MAKEEKKQVNGADNRPNHVERMSGRRIFRLDSSAYSHELPHNSQIFDQPLSAHSEPDDLIAPSIASSFTTELSHSQIPENLRAYYTAAKNAASDDFVYDLGGHMSQTIEIPIINNSTVQAADTRFGVFLELDEMLPPSQVGLAPSVSPVQPASAPQLAASPAQIPPPAPAPLPAPAPPFPAGEPKPQKPLLRRASPPAWLRRLFPARLLAFLALVVILFAPLALFSTALRVVHLTIDGQPAGTLITSMVHAEDILRQAGFSPGPADRYALTQCGLETRLELERAARVILSCDGRQQTFYALHQTVEEVLASLEIELGPDDECNLSFDYILSDRDELVVYRVFYEESRRTEPLPWQEILKPSPLIAAGTTMVMNPGGGRDGTALRTYLDKYVDGALWDSVIANEKITSFPRNVVTLVGRADAIMSTVNGSDFTDVEIVNNVPTSYQTVLSTQPCTAYSFSPGCYGASGMYLFQGFVAVNPAVIPLGSLLYITSPNGRFVYGWAIAADTGTAMVEGRITIDCFFETYRESVLFGRRTMNIYIVKQLTQAELAPYAAVEGMFRLRIPAG